MFSLILNHLPIFLYHESIQIFIPIYIIHGIHVTNNLSDVILLVNIKKML